MRFEAFSFGSVRIDGVTYEHDVVIDHERVRKRNKKPSKKFREVFGHTPLSADEDIPWKCRRLVIGTGTGSLPVMDEVKREAKRRGIKVVILPTVEAIAELEKHNSAWQKARNETGLTQVRVHDLKHTFGRRLRAAGVPLETKGVGRPQVGRYHHALQRTRAGRARGSCESSRRHKSENAVAGNGMKRTYPNLTQKQNGRSRLGR